MTLEARYFTSFNYSHHQTKPGWVRGKKTSCTMVLLLGLVDYCQAQPQLQLNWAESALFSLSTLNLLILSRNSGKVYFSAVRARIFTKFELVTLEAKYFTTFNYSHHQTKPGWVRGKKTSCTMVLLLGLFDYCQAQPQLQLNWAELALFSLSTLNLLILSRKAY